MNIGIKSILVISTALLFNLNVTAQKKFVAPESANAMINPFRGNTKATEQGKALYTNLCVACHGEKGKGDGVASAGLSVPPADHTSSKVQNQTDGVIFWKIFTGNNPMPSFKSLPQDQIWQLVDYIRTLSKNKPNNSANISKK